MQNFIIGNRNGFSLPIIDYRLSVCNALAVVVRFSFARYFRLACKKRTPFRNVVCVAKIRGGRICRYHDIATNNFLMGSKGRRKVRWPPVSRSANIVAINARPETAARIYCCKCCCLSGDSFPSLVYSSCRAHFPLKHCIQTVANGFFALPSLLSSRAQKRSLCLTWFSFIFRPRLTHPVINPWHSFVKCCHKRLD